VRLRTDICNRIHCFHQLHVRDLAQIANFSSAEYWESVARSAKLCERTWRAESFQLKSERCHPLTTGIDIQDGGIGLVGCIRSRAWPTELAGPSTPKPAVLNADLISRAMKNSSSTTRMFGRRKGIDGLVHEAYNGIVMFADEPSRARESCTRPPR